MKRREVEIWALECISRLRAGGRAEDASVEFKGPDLGPSKEKTARQLAGHANAARSDSILWIVGVANNGDVVGVGPELEDTSTWWAQVQSFFEGPTPELLDVAMEVDSRALLALAFDTQRAPFVHKPSGGAWLLVPWRDGTRTRAAKRDELLSMLIPQSTLPTLELLEASVSINESGGQTPRWTWNLSMLFYAELPIQTAVVFPDHRCKAIVQLGELELPLDNANLRGKVRVADGIRRGMEPASRVHTVHAGDDQVLITGPGTVRAIAWIGTIADFWLRTEIDHLDVTLTAYTSDGAGPISASAHLVRAEGEKLLFELDADARGARFS